MIDAKAKKFLEDITFFPIYLTYGGPYAKHTP